MKSLKLLLFILLAFTYTVQAETITVSSDPDNPGQYDDLSDAVDAASDRDTILIGNGMYGERIDLSKELVFIGPGIASVEDIGAVCPECADVSGFLLREDASGSSFIGLRAGFSIQNEVDDILIDKCQVNGMSFSNNGANNQQNILVKNSLVRNRLYFYRPGSEQQNIVFSNNIMEVQAISGNNNALPSFEGNLIFRNNIFLQMSVDIFDRIKAIVLENNIFYEAEPQDCTECTFTNNLTFDNDNNNLIGAESNNPGSIGSGNIINQDPLFVDYNGSGYENTDDFNLQSGSPAIGASTDGTDLGIYGGSYPWNIDVGTIVPEVTSLTITESSVPEDGQLEFTFSAEKQ